MKKNIIFLMVILHMFLLGCASASHEVDRVAQNTNYDSEDRRIVATTVAVTEIMDALEIDLIGIPTSYKDLPERYEGITEVGNPMSPDMELILSLQPKEVLSVTTLQYDLEEIFDKYEIDANYVNLESIDQMNEEILRLGEKYERIELAAEIVNRFNNKVAEIKAKTKDKDKPKVLILMGVPGSYLIATDRSYIGSLVEKSGGENVFQGEDIEYLASNTEHLQQTKPDIILRAAHGMPDEVVKMFDKEFIENDVWKHFEAVQNGRVYDLEERLFGTTGNLAAEEALDVLYDMMYGDE